MIDKISDELVAEWIEEYDCLLRGWKKGDPDCADLLPRTKWFIIKAFSEGQESMRERAAKTCDDSAKGIGLHMDDYESGAWNTAISLAESVRSLSINKE